MEKIYMEENQKNQKNGKNKYTIFLSMVIAVMAIASLVVVGFNQVSYAAGSEDAADDIGTEFRRVISYNVGIPKWIYFKGIVDGHETRFGIEVYYDSIDNTRPIFCVERRRDYAVDKSHIIIEPEDIPASLKSNNSNITAGITYILNNYIGTFGDIKASNANMNGIDLKVRDAAAQATIWIYLADVQKDNSEIFTTYHTLATQDGEDTYTHDEMVAAIKNVAGFASKRDNTSGLDDISGIDANKVKKGIESLVAGAKEAGKSDNILKLDISVEGNSTKLSKTSDDKFYRSNNIVVTGGSFGELKSFDVTVGGADGVKIIDSSTNNEKTHFNVGEKFYIQIPAEKVTNGVQNVHVDVTGSFEYSVARFFEFNAESQRVTTIEPSVGTADSSRRFDVVGAPNTGMSSVQTIYFIGLIVLLCGIGIIYANAKPVEEK